MRGNETAGYHGAMTGETDTMFDEAQAPRRSGSPRELKHLLGIVVAGLWPSDPDTVAQEALRERIGADDVFRSLSAMTAALGNRAA